MRKKREKRKIGEREKKSTTKKKVEVEIIVYS